MGQVAIRTVTLEDSAETARLMTQLGYPTSPAEMQERLMSIFPRQDYATFVAEASGNLVAMAGACLNHYYEKNGVYGHLIALIVDEKWRGQGLGAALVEKVEQWVKEQGAVSIMINSGFLRRDAHRFYERLGYNKTGVRFAKTLQ